MGGVLGKRPRVAPSLDYAEAAGVKEKVLADGSGRGVAHVEPIDTSAEGNGDRARALDCPSAADVTRIEADDYDGSSEEECSGGATDSAASAGQQDVEDGTFPIDQLQAFGIAVLDVKKLKDAGLHTVESVVYTPREDLLLVEGISEAKVDKIVKAASKISPLAFTSTRQLHAQRQDNIHVTTGSREFDLLLEVSAKGNSRYNGDAIEGKSSLNDELSAYEQGSAAMVSWNFESLNLSHAECDAGNTDVSSQDGEEQHIRSERIPTKWKEVAIDLDKHILRKVHVLREAILAGNLRRSKVTFFGQRIEGKIASLEAEISDRKYFHHSVSLFGKSTEWERCPPECISKLFPPPPVDLEMSRAMKRKQAQGHGIEPVTFGDSFGVPKSCLTGNVLLDEMNWMLSDIYSTVSRLLVRLQWTTAILKLELEAGERVFWELELLEVKAALHIHRNTGRKVRKEIVDLGAAPLIEPIAIWKEKFYMVKF